MGHSRPRFNKQREEQLQARRHGKRRQDDESGAAGSEEIIVPKTAEEKAREQELKAVLREQNAATGKMSAKKRRRLDNYIEKKLKKERRGELFKSLEASQSTLPSSLVLQPSSTLGSRQFKTNQDKIDRISSLGDRRRDRTLARASQRKRGYHTDSDDEEVDEDAKTRSVEQSEGADEGSGQPEAGPSGTVGPSSSATTTPVESLASETHANTNGSAMYHSDVQGRNPQPQSTPNAASVGSGLSAGAVIKVVKRQPKTIERRRFGKQPAPHLRNLAPDALDSDSSFDSSDSAHDTGSEEEDGSTDDDLQEHPSTDAGDSQSGENDFDDDGESWGGIPSGNEEDAGSDSQEASQADEGGLASEQIETKKSRFKEWAQEQLGMTARSQSEELELAKTPADQLAKVVKDKVEGLARGPLGEDLVLPAGSLLDVKSGSDHKTVSHSVGAGRPLKAVHVNRPQAIQDARMKLPILAEEDSIMELIRQHSVVVLCGETGSGKTTQVPQFLYEAGFGSTGSDNPGMTGITQPRRVAAMSMASRVAQELQLPPSRVSYQIRYDATVSPTTSIKFMTDGVLLRELANDFLLTKYSVVIVDEAHERSVNTDVLIGTLSRVVRLRENMWREGNKGMRPLRLIIMSATLRVSDFTENTQLFKTPPPVINVQARQHPVVTHFNRRTSPDYLEEAYKKVCKIHARLPPGGVLVFLTGQDEINTLCRRLEKRFGPKAVSGRVESRKRAATGTAKSKWRLKEDDDDAGASKLAKAGDSGPTDVPSAKAEDVEIENLDLGIDRKDLAADVDDALATAEVDPDALDTDDEDDEDPDGLLRDREEDSDTPLHVLPLYSLLPTDKQMRVFADPPEGHRLVVVATNVAETSLTIPNIKYVVDAGRAKERSYDQISGIQSFDVSWISKASAAQRAGRAGRTGPGHCYRLYSSAVYERQFQQFALPEILRMPIEGIVLQMKSMNIDQVVNFPFPTPPDRAALQRAERLLVQLAALSPPSARIGRQDVPARITEVGAAMSQFPLAPRFSKMLVAGQQHGCLPYVITVVAALSVGDPFLRVDSLGLDAQNGAESDGNQDFDEAAMAELALIKSDDIKAQEARKLQRKKYFTVQQRHSALGKGISDVFKMLSVVGAYEYDGGSADFCAANFVRFKAMQEIHKLRLQISRIVAANDPALGHLLTPKLMPPSELQLKVIRQLLTAAFTDQVALRKDLVLPAEFSGISRYESSNGVPYRAVGVDEDVFIHPSSILFHHAPPECVVFQELIRTSKPYIKVITKINTAWLPTLGKPLCSFSRILETSDTPGGALAKKGTTLVNANERVCYVSPKFAEFEGLHLSPVQMVQRRVGSRWEFVQS